MVQVVDYALRKSSDGREFYILIIQVGLSFVQSRNSGNFYATVKRYSIPSTFDEATAKSMIGEKVAGSVERKPCEACQWTNKETDEVIELAHRWVYLPEGATLEEAVFEGEPEVALAERKPSPLMVGRF